MHGVSGPPVHVIVGRAFADAPRSIRTQALLVGGLWIVMVGLQTWDSADGTGAAGLAEFLSVLLGSSGAALLGLAHTLQRVMAHRAAVAGRPDEAAGVRHVLLALPPLGFTAGAALAAATLLMVIRAPLGAEPPLTIVGAALYLSLTVMAGVTVMTSTRTLFSHAEANATAAARAEASAVEARLATLSAQLHPHFLFNALNTIAALTATDPGLASRATEHLAGMLRRTLERSALASGTVAEEIEYLRAYLALEEARVGPRLRVTWLIDPAAGTLSLPPLILQPLVENALRHGAGGRASGGCVTVRIDRIGSRLRARISDDGGGFPPGYRERTGLRNVRERLAVLYHETAALEIDAAAAAVTVTLPALPVGQSPEFQ